MAEEKKNEEEKKEALPEGGYYDHLEWAKMELPDGKEVKVVVFPITRYPNILNRPRVITEKSSMAVTPNANFPLLTTDDSEVSDDVIYEMFKQYW